jgi:hypothetical protein
MLEGLRQNGDLISLTLRFKERRLMIRDIRMIINQISEEGSGLGTNYFKIIFKLSSVVAVVIVFWFSEFSLSHGVLYPPH